jgi:hypothetical protein
MVAVHCLYGVDKNPLAVELAKLALWLESHAEGMPLTFLDHRLVVGDSLTGPFWDNLIMRPSNPKEPVEGIFHQGLTLALQNKLAEALSIVRHLEAKVGISVAEIEEKQRLKAELEQALRPFRIIAAAWSGGVLLGPDECDDLAYADLLKSVAETGEISEWIDSDRLRAMIGRGLAVADTPQDCSGLYRLLSSACCVPALPYDLAFPEVFYPKGVPHERGGFHAVLGNPPWDRMLPADKEFFAAYDFRVLDAPTKAQRDAVQRQLANDPSVETAYANYIEHFRGSERIVDTQYRHQVVALSGRRTIGKQDLFRLFMERNVQLLAKSGLTGVLVPSAFHANEGATGIRWLYVDNMDLRCCYSFENRRKFFEIDSRFKFALVVSCSEGSTSEFSCGFYLHNDESLFGEWSNGGPLRYTRDFIRRTGGEYMAFLELRSRDDLEVAETCFANAELFLGVAHAFGVRIGRELNLTDDAWRFAATDDVLSPEDDPRDAIVRHSLLEKGFLLLQDDKTFEILTDLTRKWRPRYLVPVEQLGDKPEWVSNARYYRLAYRDITGATNQRTCIVHLLPPGSVSRRFARGIRNKPPALLA